MKDQICPPRYIGDGVYASFDGYQIWLGLHEGQQLIALEPSVMSSLKDYEQLIIRQFENKVSPT